MVAADEEINRLKCLRFASFHVCSSGSGAIWGMGGGMKDGCLCVQTNTQIGFIWFTSTHTHSPIYWHLCRATATAVSSWHPSLVYLQTHNTEPIHIYLSFCCFVYLVSSVAPLIKYQIMPSSLGCQHDDVHILSFYLLSLCVHLIIRQANRRIDFFLWNIYYIPFARTHTLCVIRETNSSAWNFWTENGKKNLTKLETNETKQRKCRCDEIDENGNSKE